jgi:hypothetical protein
MREVDEEAGQDSQLVTEHPSYKKLFVERTMDRRRHSMVCKERIYHSGSGVLRMAMAGSAHFQRPPSHDSLNSRLFLGTTLVVVELVAGERGAAGAWARGVKILPWLAGGGSRKPPWAVTSAASWELGSGEYMT